MPINMRFNKTLTNEYTSPMMVYQLLSCTDHYTYLPEVRVSKKMVDAMRGDIPEGEVGIDTYFG